MNEEPLGNNYSELRISNHLRKNFWDSAIIQLAVRQGVIQAKSTAMDVRQIKVIYSVQPLSLLKKTLLRVSLVQVARSRFKKLFLSLETAPASLDI